MRKSELKDRITGRRNELLAQLGPRWRRCFWTWPWGHVYDEDFRPRYVDYCRLCVNCGNPERFSNISNDQYSEILAHIDDFPITRGKR